MSTLRFIQNSRNWYPTRTPDGRGWGSYQRVYRGGEHKWLVVLWADPKNGVYRGTEQEARLWLTALYALDRP